MLRAEAQLFNEALLQDIESLTLKIYLVTSSHMVTHSIVSLETFLTTALTIRNFAVDESNVIFAASVSMCRLRLDSSVKDLSQDSKRQ